MIANDMLPSTSSVCRIHPVSNSQPKLSNKQEEDEDEEMPQQDGGLFIHEVIQEMDSSMSSKSNRSPKKSAKMEESSSTMASSLERSLELGIGDGLSDMESKVRAAKSTFRTHRRAASNPTNIIDKNINKIVESSMESDDNNPVYC